MGPRGRLLPTPPPGEWAAPGRTQGAAPQEHSHAPPLARTPRARTPHAASQLFPRISGGRTGSFLRLQSRATQRMWEGRLPAPEFGGCCRARIHPSLCHWSFGVFRAEWGALPTHRGPVRSIAPSALGGPWGSGLFRPAPHGLSSHIARRRLSFILPAVARLGLLPSYPGLTLSPSPILAGKAGRHSGSGPPGIPSAGGRCQVTADGQASVLGGGDQSTLRSTRSLEAAPATSPRLHIQGPRTHPGTKDALCSRHVIRSSHPPSLSPARVGSFAPSPWTPGPTGCVVAGKQSRGGEGHRPGSILLCDLGELSQPLWAYFCICRIGRTVMAACRAAGRTQRDDA